MLKSIKTSRDRLAAKFSGSVSSTSCSSASSNEEATSRCDALRGYSVSTPSFKKTIKAPEDSLVRWFVIWVPWKSGLICTLRTGMPYEQRALKYSV